MLQVDFFWTFAIGAHLAVAAARQIKKLPDSAKFVNKYFITLVLFMAIFFGATGMVLFMNFPHWETMQVFPTHGAIPLWFVLLWFITNITNAILAYAICWYFIKKGDEYKAHLMWVIGYFVFFFVLIFGWDGTGFERFFYDATMHGWTFDNWTIGLWTPGTPVNALAWFGSNVAITLYILGCIFLPPYLYFASKWAAEGLRDDPEVKQELPEKDTMIQVKIGVYGLLGVGLTFALALASALLGLAFKNLMDPNLAALAGILGILIVAVASYFLLFKKGMPFQKFVEKFSNP